MSLGPELGRCVNLSQAPVPKAVELLRDRASPKKLAAIASPLMETPPRKA